MSKDILKHALVIFALSGFLASCTNAQSVSNRDQTKNESPSNAELIKSDEKLEAARKVASRLETEDGCVKRLKESVKVIIIGSFRTDVGCHLDGVFVDSQYFERDDTAFSKNALVALGWEKANQAEREKLAKLWVEKGLLAFSTVIYTKDKDLNDRNFQPPVADSGGNGEIKVTLWIQTPPGMMRSAKDFQRLEFRFAIDGNMMPGNSKF
ncbi:MAG: hypothetical protein ABJA66_07565 [Actinomycetota bacterium]